QVAGETEELLPQRPGETHLSAEFEHGLARGVRRQQELSRVAADKHHDEDVEDHGCNHDHRWGLPIGKTAPHPCLQWFREPYAGAHVAVAPRDTSMESGAPAAHDDAPPRTCPGALV